MAVKNPGYLSLLDNGELSRRVDAAYARLESCDISPLRCGVDRTRGELGVCQTGELARVSSFCSHPGEERPLSGWRCSGTIFFARCNLRCVYCQNADISQSSSGREVSTTDLAGVIQCAMLAHSLWAKWQPSYHSLPNVQRNNSDYESLSFDRFLQFRQNVLLRYYPFSEVIPIY